MTEAPTEDTVNIERKFLPLVEEVSALHIIVASNNDWPVAIPLDDRRFMVLDVADLKRQNEVYFAGLIDELITSPAEPVVGIVQDVPQVIGSRRASWSAGGLLIEPLHVAASSAPQRLTDQLPSWTATPCQNAMWSLICAAASFGAG